MASKIEYQRHKDKTASIPEMLDHVKYLCDTTHDDHKGYTLLPGKNYNCSGSTVDDLVSDVNRANANHFRRKKLLNHRRRTPQLWGEAIYALDDGAYSTTEERDKIEREFINRFFPDAACRATWHVNEETGACDLHIIFAWKRRCGKITLERTNVKMEKRLQSHDRFAADLLNNNPDKPANRIPHIKTSEEVAAEKAKYYSEIREEKEAAELAQAEATNPTTTRKKSKKKSTPPKKQPNTATDEYRFLAAQVARKAEAEGIDDVEAHHLLGLLELLKIKIKKIYKRKIEYFSSRTTRCGKTAKGDVRKHQTKSINIEGFLLDVLNCLVDLRIERDHEKAMEAPQPETLVENPVENPVETPPVKKTKPKRTPSEKAAALEAYLNASLGITQVSGAEYLKLTRATKSLIHDDGTIRRKMLQSLTPEQRATLVPLAAAYANQIQ